MPDALENLVIDEATLGRDELAAALHPYVRFTREGGLVLEPGFDELGAERRVLCLLLALQALHLLGYRDTDAARPGEIVDLAGMPPGTVRPKLSSLLKQRFVVKSGTSYSLPLHAARRAVKLIERRDD